MKTKNSINLTVFIVCILLTIVFVSCSKEDDNGNDNNENIIIGTWMGYSCANNNPHDLSKTHTLTLVFNSNNSGSYLEKDNMYTEQCTFTYEIEGSSKGKAYTKVRDYIYFEIVGDKMYVYDHGYGDDLDFILSKQ